MNKMMLHEIAYMAGVFDADGWFVGSDNADPGAKVAMCDFDIVEKLHEKSGLGRLESPRSTKTGRKLQKTWAITKHEEVEEFIHSIMPFIGERRSIRAREVLDQIEKRRVRRMWRETFFICGHEKIAENTYHFKDSGKTSCRQCGRKS